MLTDNQNKLIEDIRKEFSRMNTPTKVVGGGLINRAAIDDKINASIKRMAELKCITDATHKAVRELMDMDIKRLNYDLIPMGMIAQRNKNNEYYVRIDAIDKKDEERYDMFFQYQMSSAYENLPDRSGYTYYTGFHSILYSETMFRSIDELCKNDWFVKRIEEKYKSITKCK